MGEMAGHGRLYFFVGKLVRKETCHLSFCIPFFLSASERSPIIACMGMSRVFITHLAASPTVEFSLFLNSIDVIGQAVSSVLFSLHILQLPDIFPQ